MDITKQYIKDLLAGMPDGEQRRLVIAKMVRQGELTDNDLADIIVHEVMRNAGPYAELFRSDPDLQFLLQRFQGSPEYLARALVRARPDLFWHFGFAFRLILKLKADLGPVFVPPKHPSTGGRQEIRPPGNLETLIAKDILPLDIEYQMRFYLSLYSFDSAGAHDLLVSERKDADEYGRLVLDGVEAQFERLLGMKFPGVITELNENLFPALHVRWWIERARTIPRILNIGDTGTFKTSFGFVGLHSYDMKHVLVICAPGARQNHRREVERYFPDGESRVQVLESRNDLVDFVGDFERRQFHIVGWSAFATERREVLDTLLALPFDAIFIDECQYGKGVIGENASLRARAMMQLGTMPQLKRVLACSATPWENRPEELAGVASLIRPDLFGNPEDYLVSGLTDTPRVVRELFAENVLDIELREVRKMPAISPKPWEDLFGEQAIPMNPEHRRIYDTLHDDDTVPRIGASKTKLLLKAAIHPALVRDDHPWDAATSERLKDWRLSSKLVWLKQFLDERIGRAKIVVGTGIFVSGITHEHDEETPWIGDLLKQWYGENAVAIMDGNIKIGSERDGVIRRWKSRPDVRILLVSMLTCPDSINLTVPVLPGVEELWITSISCAWKPWKQFLGRFWREGQGIPIHYTTPILPETIDDDLLRFNQKKWEVQQLFKATVPLTSEEWEAVSQSPGGMKLHELTRSPWENVTYLANAARGAGEEAVNAMMNDKYGVATKAAVFARDFLAIQESGPSGNIARFIAKTAGVMRESDMLTSETIFDAGCGTIMLARTLNLPIFGRDMNSSAIELARREFPALAANTATARLSALPPEWTGRFHLTVSSLVLDWTSLIPDATGTAERVRILRELVRVTHPQGQLWITLPELALTEEGFAAWCEQFRRNGFSISAPLSGLVSATDGPKNFSFWSLLVSPDGNSLQQIDPKALHFAFETGRMKKKKRGNSGGDLLNRTRSAFAHQDFIVAPMGNGVAIEDAKAADEAVIAEIKRWVGVASTGRPVGRNARLTKGRFQDLNWRVLDRLVQLGVIST